MVKKNDDNMLSRFHLIPERYGQTDRIAISISRVSVLTCDKNCTTRIHDFPITFAYLIGESRLFGA